MHLKSKTDNKNWILKETRFDIQHQGKCESTMHLANGYAGIRSAFEETYPYQTRGMFIAGTFNKSNGDTTELPNAADTCCMDIILDDEPFSMATGKMENYQRSLNLFTGELERSLTWTSPAGKVYRLVFRRFVSNVDVHSYGTQVRITPESGNACIRVSTGINARMTNSGTQHFVDGVKRVIDKKYLYLSQSTTESNITFAHGCFCDIQNAEIVHTDFGMERRLLTANYVFNVEQNSDGILNKISSIYTSNDFDKTDDDQLLNVLVDHMKMQERKGFSGLQEENARWYCEFWKQNDIVIDSDNDQIILAVRYAQFNLRAMLPVDSRSSIAAKGLSGEGYKGHVFWDTEIFMLPYFLYTNPLQARRLLEYRLNTLDQGIQNARRNGCRGIMFPWESASTGEEETPKYASMNILTGKAARVWAGDKEHHITADIAFAAIKYFKATKDDSFLEEGGALLIVGCALFWVSRAVCNFEKAKYEILDIIGPDEYTEHINNNAYTNYISCAVVEDALKIYRMLPEEKRKIICDRLEEQNIETVLQNFYEKIYLPEPDGNGIIPQDDTFMQKTVIDVEKYRLHNTKQMILKDYSRSQVNDMQVLKQADVVMLMYVLRERFQSGIKKSNLLYYEPKTIHDSSLSRAIHALVACDCDEIEFAYEQFLSAIDTDIGDNPVSSDPGIHAASMGGIWLDVIEGFAGAYVVNGELYINPKLPEKIRSIAFRYEWMGVRFWISVTPREVVISCGDEKPKTVRVCNKQYLFSRSLKVAL